MNSINGGGSQRYLGDSLTVPTGSATADVNPPLSYGSAVLQNNFTVSVGFLKEPLRVRVSKQAVSNTAGGNAYIGAKVGYSVNTITNEFLSSIKSGNFVVTSNASNVGNSLNGADGTIGVQSAENINVGSTNVGT